MIYVPKNIKLQIIFFKFDYDLWRQAKELVKFDENNLGDIPQGHEAIIIDKGILQACESDLKQYPIEVFETVRNDHA